MKPLMVAFVALSSLLWGMSYQSFKRYALKHAAILQSQALELDATRVNNAIALRQANPQLTVEGARFHPNGGSVDTLMSVQVSQAFRTPWYQTSLERQSDAAYLVSQALRTQGKAGYLRELETLYTRYVYQSRLSDLLRQEYRLSQKMMRIVQDRYQKGSENKVALLRARTQTMSLKSQWLDAKRQTTQLHYQLLAVAGLNKKVALETRFIYPVHVPKTAKQSTQNPQTLLLQARKRLFQAKAELNRHTWRNWELYGAWENEPDQSILRVGVNVPLPVFNTRSEERQLARLRMRQTELEQRQYDTTVQTKRTMLKETLQTLIAQYRDVKALWRTQRELVSLLEETYRVAKGSLFELMKEKQTLIQTRKRLLQLQRAINMQTIALRYLQGAYND